jgi:hypothetical protein
MTRARSELIRSDKPGTYHLITRCVRRERLLEKGERRVWLARGLAAWLPHMGIDLLAYALMGNHVHLVVRLRPDIVAGWDARTVARHALAVLPVRSGPGMESLSVTSVVVDRYADDAAWIAEQRERLSSPSWLLRLVKQEISRRANAEDGCTGHFWEKRFTSVALLDAAAVLACMVYVDLNPQRAGMVRDPAEAVFASIRHRSARARGEGRMDEGQPDEALGRCLVAMPRCAPHDQRSAMPTTWNLTEQSYVALVHETATCLRRDGRAAVAAALDAVRAHGISATAWIEAMGRAGAMSGSVIGGPDARRTWCAAAGQRWAADKSGLWSG